MGIVGNEADDYVGSFAEVEVVGAGGPRVGPGRNWKALRRGDGVGEQDVPLLGGWGDIDGFAGSGFEEADEDLRRIREGEVDGRLLLGRYADSGEAFQFRCDAGDGRGRIGVELLAGMPREGLPRAGRKGERYLREARW